MVGSLNYFKMFERKVSRDELTSMIQRVSNLELEMEKLRTHINSLRGLINRKQELILDRKDTEPEKETSKNKDGLDSLRFK